MKEPKIVVFQLKRVSSEVIRGEEIVGGILTRPSQDRVDIVLIVFIVSAHSCHIIVATLRCVGLNIIRCCR